MRTPNVLAGVVALLSIVTPVTSEHPQGRAGLAVTRDLPADDSTGNDVSSDKVERNYYPQPKQDTKYQPKPPPKPESKKKEKVVKDKGKYKVDTKYGKPGQRPKGAHYKPGGIYKPKPKKPVYKPNKPAHKPKKPVYKPTKPKYPPLKHNPKPHKPTKPKYPPTKPTKPKYPPPHKPTKPKYPPHKPGYPHLPPVNTRPYPPHPTTRHTTTTQRTTTAPPVATNPPVAGLPCNVKADCLVIGSFCADGKCECVNKSCQKPIIINECTIAGDCGSVNTPDCPADAQDCDCVENKCKAPDTNNNDDECTEDSDCDGINTPACAGDLVCECSSDKQCVPVAPPEPAPCQIDDDCLTDSDACSVHGLCSCIDLVCQGTPEDNDECTVNSDCDGKVTPTCPEDTENCECNAEKKCAPPAAVQPIQCAYDNDCAIDPDACGNGLCSCIDLICQETPESSDECTEDTDCEGKTTPTCPQDSIVCECNAENKCAPPEPPVQTIECSTDQDCQAATSTCVNGLGLCYCIDMICQEPPASNDECTVSSDCEGQVTPTCPQGTVVCLCNADKKCAPPEIYPFPCTHEIDCLANADGCTDPGICSCVQGICELSPPLVSTDECSVSADCDGKVTPTCPEGSTDCECNAEKKCAPPEDYVFPCSVDDDCFADVDVCTDTGVCSCVNAVCQLNDPPSTDECTVNSDCNNKVTPTCPLGTTNCECNAQNKCAPPPPPPPPPRACTVNNDCECAPGPGDCTCTKEGQCFRTLGVTPYTECGNSQLDCYFQADNGVCEYGLCLCSAEGVCVQPLETG